MKQTNALKLTCLAASVAVLGMGCASTGHARYDADSSTEGVGVSARSEMAGETSATLDESDIGPARVTVSALSFSPETRADWVNKFPFYDYRVRVIETHTFAVPDPTITASVRTDLPEFSVNLPPGSVFVEAAGGAGEAEVGRVIQHSPNPSR
jgi:hypothetical protein